MGQAQHVAVTNPEAVNFSSTNFDAIDFEVEDLDAALGDLAIESDLPLDVQRMLASRVLITSSLAASCADDDVYKEELAKLGDMPEDPKFRSFMSQFSKGLVDELNDEIGDEAAQIGVMTRRISALAFHA